MTTIDTITKDNLEDILEDIEQAVNKKYEYREEGLEIMGTQEACEYISNYLRNLLGLKLSQNYFKHNDL